MRRLRTTHALTALILLAGCASSVEDCDPHRVNNVFTSLSCRASGGFADHLEAARKEVEVLRQRVALSREEALAADRQAAALVRNRSAFQRKIKDDEQALTRLESRLKTAKAGNDRERARLKVLQEEMNAAFMTLEELKGGKRTQEEIVRLQADIAAKQRLIDIGLAPPAQE